MTGSIPLALFTVLLRTLLSDRILFQKFQILGIKAGYCIFPAGIEVFNADHVSTSLSEINRIPVGVGH